MDYLRAGFADELVKLGADDDKPSRALPILAALAAGVGATRVGRKVAPKVGQKLRDLLEKGNLKKLRADPKNFKASPRDLEREIRRAQKDYFGNVRRETATLERQSGLPEGSAYRRLTRGMKKSYKQDPQDLEALRARFARRGADRIERQRESLLASAANYEARNSLLPALGSVSAGLGIPTAAGVAGYKGVKALQNRKRDQG